MLFIKYFLSELICSWVPSGIHLDIETCARSLTLHLNKRNMERKKYALDIEIFTFKDNTANY